MARDEEDFDEESPRKKGKKGKGKPFFTKKRTTLIVAVVALLVLGALIQHFVIEPLYGETVEQKYARCLTQKDVLDERYVKCTNEQDACGYQLNQCLGVS